MRATAVVFLKELREGLRDRRVLVNTFLVGPLIGPLIFMVLIRFVIGRELEQAEGPLPVAVIGVEYAPNMVAALKQSGLEVRPAVADAELAVRQQRLDLALRIPSTFAADWRAGRMSQVELIYDSSRRETASKVARLHSMLENYSRRTGAMRLVMRGLTPALVSPLYISERDQATPRSRGALLFGILPYMLVFTAFLGGMSLAIDATAGERERQSLEPLLVNPVPRWQILLGKLGAASVFSLTAVCLSLAAFAVAGNLLPSDQPDLTVDVGAHFAGIVLPVMVPLVLLIAVLQTLVAAYANSYREAQTHLGLLQLIPMIPSALLSFLPFKQQLWMYAVPMVSQQLTIMRLLRGETVNWLQGSLSVLTTLVATVLAFLVAKRIYGSERLAIST